MDVSRVLIDIIQHKGEVAVPGLGTFKLSYTPAEIYKYTNRVIPPKYRIDFVAEPDIINQELEKEVSEVFNTSNEAAEELIKNLVTELTRIVDSGNTFEIKDLGTFSKKKGKLVFNEDIESHLLAGNFGLETTELPLIELDEQETHLKPIKHGALPRYVQISLWVAGSIIVFFFIMGTLYQRGYLDKPIELMYNFFSISTINKQQLATNDTLAGKIDAYDLKRAALQYDESAKLPSATKTVSNLNSKVNSQPEPSSEIKSERGRVYYIIAGSYKTLQNAKRFERKLIVKGYSPVTISIADTLFRVSISNFTNRQKAIDEYVTISTKDPDLKIWVYTRTE
jgi:nucleoid DNA-binding protein